MRGDADCSCFSANKSETIKSTKQFDPHWFKTYVRVDVTLMKEVRIQRREASCESPLLNSELPQTCAVTSFLTWNRTHKTPTTEINSTNTPTSFCISLENKIFRCWHPCWVLCLTTVRSSSAEMQLTGLKSSTLQVSWDWKHWNTNLSDVFNSSINKYLQSV